MVNMVDISKILMFNCLKRTKCHFSTFDFSTGSLGLQRKIDFTLSGLSNFIVTG